MRLPISAVIVTHDEAELLERCIKSFYKLVDEIIIVCDGKPTDNTIKIAKKYTSKIYVKKHFGYPEIHRPFTFKLAKNDWLLMPDSDEFLSETLQKNLKNLIKKNVDIYDFLWPAYDNRKYYNNAHKRTLFRKSKIYYFSAMNQNVLPIDESVKIKKLDYKIWHLPNVNRFNFKNFINRYNNISNINARQFAGVEKMTLWNCKNIKWEARNLLRIKHPIILGIFGSVTYHLCYGLLQTIKTLKIFHLKQSFFTALYCLLTFGKLALLHYDPKESNAHQNHNKAVL